MTGRRRAAALVTLAMLVAAGACGDGGRADAGNDDGGAEPAEAATWAFADGRGDTVELDSPPETIAAQSVAAGALWELGVEADGVFGPLRRPDGSPDPAIGLADPDAFDSIGDDAGQINLERLAALQPDVIVTAMWSETEYWGIDDEVADEVAQIAPIVGVRVDDRTLDQPLAEFAELAESLGADPTRVAEARAAFDAASDELAQALAANPELKVVAASGSLSEMYIAYPPAFPDLRSYQQLGMNLAEPESHPTSGGYWETLSWEQAGKYPADLLLADARGGTVEQILEFLPPTARNLPAVQAGQLVSWPTATPYGYRNYAAIMRDLADDVAHARVVADLA